MPEQRKFYDLIHHLEHVGYRQPEIGNTCDVHAMVQAIFDEYDPMQSWYANLGAFMIDTLGYYRNLDRPSDEPMVTWLKDFAIGLTEFELAQM